MSVQLGPRPLLDGVTLTLERGRAYLLTGANGSGKSTLLALIAGQLAPLKGTRRYWLDGEWRSSAVRARQAILLVSPAQETFYLTRDWVQTVQDVLLAALDGDTLRLRPPTPAGLARLAEVSALTRLNSLLTHDFRTLSHGQRRRVLLARALMPRPAALLLDEYTDGLSLGAREELCALLERVAAEGTAVVLATHRPEEAPRLPWQRWEVMGGRVRRSAAPLAPPEAGHGPQLQRTGGKLSPDGELLVALEDVQVIRNGQLALGPISWQWRRGEHWLVTGENGAGKSTLARTVAGELHPALGGRVQRPFLARDQLSERRRHIGIVGAELGIRARAGGERRDWTGREVIASGFGGTEGFAAPIDAAQTHQLERLAGVLGLSELLPLPAAALSQGQLGRLLLARAVVHRPVLLVLDEGLNFLDGDARAGLLGLLPGLMAAGTHLLVVAHREEDVPVGLNRWLRLEAGRGGVVEG